MFHPYHSLAVDAVHSIAGILAVFLFLFFGQKAFCQNKDLSETAALGPVNGQSGARCQGHACLALQGAVGSLLSVLTAWLLPHPQPSSAAGGGRELDLSQPTETTGSSISCTEERKLSKSQQLKKIFQEYGTVGVSLHIGISLVSLGIFYMIVSSGMDMSAVLLKLGFEESLVQSKMAAGTSTFVVAYAIHKLFAPVRISITLVSVPLIVRYFRKVGFFKPPAAKP
uniref:Family with sequence similarity 210 member B n=1 Tax=Saimiri boliviensis boliviensis TaxID=39432 RepID=A0A2K6T9I5_SAIBB